MTKHFLLIIGVLLMTLNCNSQNKINQSLKKELEEILFTDQVYREYIDNSTTKERKNEIAKLINQDPEYFRQNVYEMFPKNDSINFLKIEKIINQYGYPDKKIVGEPANTAVFYVIQHNPDKIPKYYPIIEKAGKKGELPFYLVAMMLDRKLANEGKQQIYGSQIYGRKIINKQTGKEEFFSYVVPIKDAKNVNKRRKKAGFESTIEVYAKDLGVEYKKYTYSDLNKMFNYKTAM